MKISSRALIISSFKSPFTNCICSGRDYPSGIHTQSIASIICICIHCLRYSLRNVEAIQTRATSTRASPTIVDVEATKKQIKTEKVVKCWLKHRVGSQLKPQMFTTIYGVLTLYTFTTRIIRTYLPLCFIETSTIFFPLPYILYHCETVQSISLSRIYLRRACVCVRVFSACPFTSILLCECVTVWEICVHCTWNTHISVLHNLFDNLCIRIK